MTISVNPKMDYAFKWLFGNEKNKGLLIHLLNAVLDPKPGARIVEVERIKPEDERMEVLGVKARDPSGRDFNIQIQMLDREVEPRQAVLNWAMLHAYAAIVDDDFENPYPTLSVYFINDIIFPTIPECHTVFRLLDPKSGMDFASDMPFHLFELPKFRLTADEPTTAKDAWLYFLQCSNHWDAGSVLRHLNMPEIRDAMNGLRMLQHAVIARKAYESRIKMQTDQGSLLHAAGEIYQKAFEEGYQETFEKSYQQGMASMVLEQLEHKFGAPDDSQRKLVLAAKPDQLLTWAERLLTAQSWKEAVEDP